MNFENTIVAGLLIKKEYKDVQQLQDVLTSYGNVIRTRLGLNDPVDNENVNALMLLELVGVEEEINNLFSELSELEGIEVKEMRF